MNNLCKGLTRRGLMVIALLLAFTIPVEAGDDRSKKVSVDTVKEIVQKMTRDGLLTQECIQEGGGPAKVVRVNPISLSKDGNPQFEVSAGDKPTSCTIGARCSYYWLYDNKANGYRLLLDAGPIDELKKTKDVTKDYRDVETGTYMTAGEIIYLQRYKFNGTKYELKSSKEKKTGLR